MSPESNKALGAVLSEIDKQWGKGSIMRFGDKPEPDPDSVISSGSIGLDAALGIGGYKKGRIIEIYGGEGAGKTSICLHAIAEAQKAGTVCAFIDAEHALDPAYAKNLGVQTDDLLISQPDSGEQALEMTNMLVRSGEVGLVIIDSVAALIPQKELEGEVGDQFIGLQARMMSQAMRMLVGSTSKTNSTIIFINQIRMKIGVFMGSPETTCVHPETKIELVVE